MSQFSISFHVRIFYLIDISHFYCGFYFVLCFLEFCHTKRCSGSILPATRIPTAFPKTLPTPTSTPCKFRSIDKIFRGVGVCFVLGFDFWAMPSDTQRPLLVGSEDLWSARDRTWSTTHKVNALPTVHHSDSQNVQF